MTQMTIEGLRMRQGLHIVFSPTNYFICPWTLAMNHYCFTYFLLGVLSYWLIWFDYFQNGVVTVAFSSQEIKNYTSFFLTVNKGWSTGAVWNICFINIRILTKYIVRQKETLIHIQTSTEYLLYVPLTGFIPSFRESLLKNLFILLFAYVELP